MHRLRRASRCRRTCRCSPSPPRAWSIADPLGREPARRAPPRSTTCAPRATAQLDLPAALAELRERFAVRTLLCEGGPHLNSPAARRRARRRAVPVALARSSPAATRRTARRCGSSPARSSSRRSSWSCWACSSSDSHLFLRYGVSAARERVSRETTLEQLARQLTPFRGHARRGGDAHHHLVAVELLERDPRRVAQRRLQGLLEHLLQVAGRHARRAGARAG